MKNKLLSILLHPVFIALVISFVIFYFLPDYFTKYKIELVGKNYMGKKQRIYFEDLNGDYKSEKIYAQTNTEGNASFVIYSASGEIIDQWNLSKRFALDKKLLYFFDIDKNGFKEIYMLTQSGDSIFYNCLEPLNKINILDKEQFIDTIGKYKNNYQINSFQFRFDCSSDKKEIFIPVNSGHSGYPRNIYKIDMNNNSVKRSPHLVNHADVRSFADLNGDGTKELLISNGSSCNTIDSTITKRSDYSSWLNVLDHDLNFLFKPIEFPSSYSSINTTPVKNNFGGYDILCLLRTWSRIDSLPSRLMLYSYRGKLIKDKVLPKGKFKFYSGTIKRNFILYDAANGTIYKYNFDLEPLGLSVLFEPQTSIFNIDLNNDNKPEWMGVSYDQNNVTIYDESLESPIQFKIPYTAEKNIYHGLKQISKNENHIFFQRGNRYFIYKYSKNSLYVFRHLIYMGIFLLVFGVVWLIRKGQKIQMEKQRAIEDQISVLQIKTIKNQVDPHFVFNAVNTISEMMLMNDKLEADRFISRFSKLMRETLQKSDKITTTLQEEIDYVDNYIQLQRTRFNHIFEYQIKKDLSVDYKMQVPNHVIYSYVENAIKHGLRNRKDGLLTILIESRENDIRIMIENNGEGIDHSSIQKKNSTGNGIKIMEKIYALYEKIYHKKITHQLTEMMDNQGNISGVRVVISISK